MSNKNEWLELIKHHYDDASNNEAADLANAKTLVEVVSIQANVANASVAYYRAIASKLLQSNDNIENAYTDAVNAQKAITEARKEQMAIADLLEKFSDATNKVTILLNNIISSK